MSEEELNLVYYVITLAFWGFIIWMFLRNE